MPALSTYDSTRDADKDMIWHEWLSSSLLAYIVEKGIDEEVSITQIRSCAVSMMQGCFFTGDAVVKPTNSTSGARLVAIQAVMQESLLHANAGQLHRARYGTCIVYNVQTMPSKRGRDFWANAWSASW